jgi:ABC-type microcin C transport system permease subunit YejE
MAHFFNTKCDFHTTSRVSITVFFCPLIMAYLLLSLIKLVILQVILLILEKNVTLFITDIQRYIRTNFHVSLWEQRKYLEDVTQDSVKREYRYLCYGHPFRYYLNSYLYFLDSFIQNPFHLIFNEAV